MSRANETSVAAKQQVPRFSFAGRTRKPGCPIHSALFAEWVGEHEPRPNLFFV